MAAIDFCEEGADNEANETFHTKSGGGPQCLKDFLFEDRGP